MMPARKLSFSTAAYSKVGEFGGAIDQDAERLFQDFHDEQTAIQLLFQRITELGAGDKPIRRPDTMPVLREITGLSEERLPALVLAFEERGLLVRRLLENGEMEVDLPHECVMWKWKRLQGWIREEAETAKFLGFLRDAAGKQQWLTGPVRIHASSLLQTGRLDGHWSQRYLSASDIRDVRKLIEVSEARHAGEMQRLVRERRRARLTAIGAMAAALIFAGLGYWAYFLKNRADGVLARTAVQDGTRLAEDRERPDPGQAMGYFARGLRRVRGSAPASRWISDLLLLETWWLPVRRLQHEDSVNLAGFSPDGRFVVTASFDKTARVWDASTGAPVGTPLRHGDKINSAIFSPDSRTVVTASSDRSARIWDALTGNPVGIPMTQAGPVYYAVFSPDSRRVASGGVEGARIWDATTGQPVSAPLKHSGTESVTYIAFSPDGRRVVTAAGDNTARVFDAESGNQLSVLSHEGAVYSAEFSRDGRYVVTASEDKKARVWEVGTGKETGPTLIHQGGVYYAVFSPDGRRIATASADKTARLWDRETGKPTSLALVHEGAVNAVVFSPEGSRVLTASFDGTARVWDSESGKPLSAPLQHEKWVNSADFSPDGRRIVTASNDGTARIWEEGSGKPERLVLPHAGMVVSAHFSPDGQRLVTACDNRTAQVWDARTGKGVGGPLQHGGGVNSAVFSRDGKRVVTASEDRAARVWDVASGNPVGDALRHTERVNSAAFSPDGRLVVTASDDKTARVWEAETGKPVGPPLQTSDPVVLSAVFTADGRYVVTASGAVAQVWGTGTGKRVALLRHDDRVSAVAVSRDGRRVATSSWIGRLRSGKPKPGSRSAEPCSTPRRSSLSRSAPMEGIW